LLVLLDKLNNFCCKVDYPHINSITVNTYIGISHFPSHGNSSEELIKALDLALLSSKRLVDEKYTFFTFNLQYDFNRKLLLEEQLKQAIDNNEIVMHFQPQYHMVEHRLIGAEVLIRWNSAKLGYLYPDSFIHVAESNHTIIPITYWIFNSVCQFIQDNKLKYTQFPKIAINFSPKQLECEDLIGHLKQILSRYPLVTFSDIEIEITESVMLCKSVISYSNLTTLKEEGAEISMDDFGTGYSTLDYLVKLPITKIKIDKSFVLHLFTQDDSYKPNYNYIIVKAIISLANNLNIKVIAEGVETEKQQIALISEGCFLGQGYLFSKPIPEADFLQLLR
jgi:EAL domain-containing protein (putative c-di-GMP-specific phosphodiesterase class I)